MKDVLVQRAVERFVGRKAEVTILLHTLEADGPLVSYIYGIGGIGKSSLLNAFTEQVRARGVTVIRLDCRQIEPSRRGFLAELGAAIGRDVATAEAAGERLGQLGERVILTLDT